MKSLLRIALAAILSTCVLGALLGAGSDFTVLASAARTVLTDSSTFTNTTGTTVVVYLNVTATAAGTGGLTVRIEGKDTLGHFFYLNAAPTAVTATGQYAYVLGPGATSTGGSVAQATAVPLPRTWRVEVTVGDSTSYTYSVAASTF